MAHSEGYSAPPPLCLPHHRRTISSLYGKRRDPFTGAPSFHLGLDFDVPGGTPVRPIGAGRVVSKRWHPGNGNTVTVDHGEGVVSKYMHLRHPSPLKPGDLVTPEDRLGVVGNTGTASRGDHLHLEILVHGRRVDPLEYLNSLTQIEGESA